MNVWISMNTNGTLMLMPKLFETSLF